MATTTVRITAETQAKLKAIASEDGASIQDVLAQAIEAFRRQRLIEQTNAAYAALRSDEAAWSEEQRERAAWDVTLADGLADD